MAGYVSPEPFQPDAELELLDTTGKIVRFSWDQVKWVCYLRDLNAVANEPANPERLLQKRFRSRPRAAGIWVRLTLLDHDLLEGITANDISLIRGSGLFLTPPDTRSNTQRIFVPEQAIETLEVLGLIGTSDKRRARPLASESQPNLFSDPPEPPATDSGDEAGIS